ncbi:hypothetical protein EJ08DRAFT_699518 [Tothia fuscella]|uniref:Condensation domain-containing protein n=1 Tax=Tothia fuscella TaxID=1048955 RepID=A0A9P4TVF6_9PEZI|nr:hypothetical protein EJ08DRAFT_699518 [Tothia fuscella]
MESYPDVDPSVYRWHQSKDNPSRWRRQAVGSETSWLLKPKVFREMFISACLILETSVSQSCLSTAAERAWIDLRVQISDFTVTPVIGEDKKTIYIEYDTPRNEDEIRIWLDRTMFVKDLGRREMDFRELRRTILESKTQPEVDQAYLLLCSVLEPGESGLVIKVNIMVNTDHQVTDGTGTRILLGRYLALLATALSKYQPAPLDLNDQTIWKEAISNLAPAWPMIMNTDQVTSGTDYQLAVADNKATMRKLGTNPGLPLLQEPTPPSQEFHSITLDQAKTTALLAAIKTQLYKNATVTHVGHAAMVLAMLRLQNLSSSDKNKHSLYSPCWLNGRRCLTPYGYSRDPRKWYVPCLVSYSPIIFPSLEDLVLRPGASRAEVRDMLVKGCNVAEEGYKELREKTSVLPQMVALVEEDGMKRLGEFLAGKKQKDSREVGTAFMADPYFISDGITEQYIDREYFDSFSDPIRMIFEIGNVAFAANAEKNLIVRMSSWRGQLTVVGEWEGQYYRYDEIVEYLEDIISVMLTLIDEG